MTMFYTRDLQAQDLNADSAYRAWLISRNQAPIIHHSPAVRWKRFCVALRHLRGAVAAVHMALVADKMCRARAELARVRLRR